MYHSRKCLPFANAIHSLNGRKAEAVAVEVDVVEAVEVDVVVAVAAITTVLILHRATHVGKACMWVVVVVEQLACLAGRISRSRRSSSLTVAVTKLVLEVVMAAVEAPIEVAVVVAAVVVHTGSLSVVLMMSNCSDWC